jgi:lipoprotein NlpI
VTVTDRCPDEGALNVLGGRARGRAPAEGWDAIFAGFVLDRVTEDALLQKVASSDDKAIPDCEAWFFIAIKHQMAGDEKGAAEGFKKCIAAAKTNLPLYYWIPPPEPWLAAWELERASNKSK